VCAEQALEEHAREDLKTLSIFLKMYSFEKMRKVYRPCKGQDSSPAHKKTQYFRVEFFVKGESSVTHKILLNFCATPPQLVSFRPCAWVPSQAHSHTFRYTILLAHSLSQKHMVPWERARSQIFFCKSIFLLENLFHMAQTVVFRPCAQIPI
jgi:hypothetical protein